MPRAKKNPAARPPDFKVLASKPYKVGRETKYKYFEVGAGWANDNGSFNFTIVTSPGVTFYLAPVEGHQEFDDEALMEEGDVLMNT